MYTRGSNLQRWKRFALVAFHSPSQESWPPCASPLVAEREGARTQKARSKGCEENDGCVGSKRLHGRARRSKTSWETKRCSSKNCCQRRVKLSSRLQMILR